MEPNFNLRIHKGTSCKAKKSMKEQNFKIEGKRKKQKF